MVGLMIGAGSMMAVVCVRSCVMVDLVVSGRICDGGDGVPFSTQGVGRRAVVVVGLERAGETTRQQGGGGV